MNEASLIPVFYLVFDGVNTQVFDARSLWRYLDIRQDFSQWIRKQITKGQFVEGQDYVIKPYAEDIKRGRPNKDYKITLSMAREITRRSHSTESKEALAYFHQTEKQYSDWIKSGAK
jgi:phage anti-repressor protein